MRLSQLLEKKNINPSFNTYFVQATSAMAQGLFCSLLIGLIMSTIGQKAGIAILVEAGAFAMSMLGACIGASIAYALSAPPMVIFSCVIVGFIGNKLGGAVGAYIATLISCELGKLVFRTTKLDIIVTPLVTILSGLLVAKIVAPPIAGFMKMLGVIIMQSTELHPFFMGIAVATIMGIVLTLPISRAALSIMLDLGGLAGGAATVGCAAQMIGFAAASYRENKVSGLISQGIGTSMLQIGNIAKNPKIWIPPTLAGIIIAPLSTIVFKMQNLPAGSGMGTSGLVGQFTTIAVMGHGTDVLLMILLLHFILPAALAFAISEFMRKAGYIKFGDQKLE